MTHQQATMWMELKDGFLGDLLLPGHEEYEPARRVWNATIDRRPALIARCAGTADVVRAVNAARSSGLVLAVRGGGHNIAGNSVVDGGIVIDLSLMCAVRVDAAARRVTVEAGATLGELDAATQAYGLAVPLGINSTTGVAGLTLGGGFGWLSRAHGLAIDSLESVQLVNAQGEVLRASARENADLFWALRGGGGNFGVVTHFEFRLHAVGPELLSGLVVYPLSSAKTVLRRYREFVAEAPNELSVWAVLRTAPPLPFLPERAHGTPIVALALLHAGDAERGAELVQPLVTWAEPLGEHVGVRPYVAWQRTFDPLLKGGARNYWKSHNLSSLDDGLIDVAVDAVERLPSPQCEVFIAALGGAASLPSSDATAYPHRDTRYVMNVHGRWDDPADDARVVAWARTTFVAAAPYTSGGVYVNFMTAEERERVPAAYGPNYERLTRVKRAYDPDNLFCMNQNVEPA